MRTIQIIEFLPSKKEKYRVIHDFNKTEVTTSEINFVMKSIVSHVRNNTDPKFNIKDSDVYLVAFDNDKLIKVFNSIELWDNIPKEYIDYYVSCHDSVKDFIERNRSFINDGFIIDYPFCEGKILFEYINQN